MSNTVCDSIIQSMSRSLRPISAKLNLNHIFSKLYTIINFPLLRRVRGKTFLILFFSLSSFAQSQKTIDSLQVLVNIASEDTSKVNLLNTLFAKIRIQSAEQALPYAEKALTLAHKISYKQGEAKALENKGIYYWIKKEFDKALDCNWQAIQLMKTVGNKQEQARLMMNVAELYKVQAGQDKALGEYIEALKIVESELSTMDAASEKRLETQKLQARLYHQIGRVYRKQHHFKEAIANYAQSLKIYTEMNDEKAVADASLSLGMAYYDANGKDKAETFVFKGEHKEAKYYLTKAKKIYEKTGNSNGVINANNYLAYVSAGQGEFGLGVQYGLEGLKAAKEKGNREMEASLSGTIGDIYYAQGNYRKALEYFNNCYEGAKEVNNKAYIKDIYLSYSRIYSKLNDYKSAYEYYKRYTEMKDELSDEQVNRQIAEMNAKYDSEKKDKELVTKDAELAQREAESRQQHFQRDVLAVVIVCILIVVFFIYRGYRNNKKAKVSISRQKEELEQSYKNIAILSDIEREITSTITVEKVIEIVYENINKLMNAEVFCIGIHNEKNNSIDFPAFIEKGVKYNSTYSLDDMVRLPVICFKNKFEIFINDLEQEYSKYIEYIPKPAAGETPESLIYVPLINKKKIIGVICVESFSKNAYTKHHLNILQNLATYIAIALENAQLYKNLEEKIQERTAEVLEQKEAIEKSYTNTQLMSDVGREITSVLTVEEIIKKVYENVNRLMDASAFGIGIYDDQSQRLNFSGFIEKGERLPFYYVSVSETTRPAIWCFTRQEELVINDFQTEFHNYFPDSEIPAPKEGDQPESMIYLPLSTVNKRVGVITVQSFQKNAYSNYQLNILRNLALYVVNGLENARLYENMEEEVKARTLEIRQQNEKITDSINYAQKIQETLLPPLDEIHKYLPQAFILYKPKDIVSGDFYWVYKEKNKIFIAVADCTGHGVPGAFMSLMGNNLLNDIVKVKAKHKPSDILDELNEQILTTLNQNNRTTSVKYGMDIALICIEQDSLMLEYSGAHSPLLIYRNNECIQLKANKRSIGSYVREEEAAFTNHTFQLQKSDMLYMFSDGYADQIGGSENKKMFAQPFRDTLQSVAMEDVTRQKQQLADIFKNWQGTHSQTDDVLVLGIRI